jgi:membrane protein involved in D-alanine export
MIDFWDRWHISLSTFVRRNLFIPLQLSLVRRSPNSSRLLLASFAFGVSFLTVGLWHGLTFRYFLWGGLHSTGLILNNTWREWLSKRFGRAGVKAYMASWPIRIVATAITFEFVAFSLTLVGGKLL